MAIATLTRLRSVQLVAALALFAGLIVVSPIGAAMLSPAMALLAAVALGWFTGERPVAWIRRVARRRRNRRVRPAPIPTPPRPDWLLPVGVRVAFDLAMRPPPAHQR